MKNLIVHGTPITPHKLLDQLAGGSFCVSFADPRDIERCIDLVGDDQILVLDNGAFTHWKAGGGGIDRGAFWAWANEVQSRCPQAVAVIPDVIEGSEEQNRTEIALALKGGLSHYPERTMAIWHMNESMDQLRELARACRYVGMGSCAEYDVQRKRAAYLRRLGEVTSVLDCLEAQGERRPWTHLMRGLGVLHLAKGFNSADSTNIARNHCRTKARPQHVMYMAARIATKINPVPTAYMSVRAVDVTHMSVEEMWGALKP